MPITLPVEGRADERSFDRVADQAERRLAEAGKDAGKAFAKGLDDAAAKADPKSAERWTKAYDKVADSAGKVRVEEAKLADLRERGASNTRLIAQAEALERARRAETRATREAASAYQDLNTRANGVLGVVGDLASGTRFGGMIASTQSLTSQFGTMGLAIGGTVTAMAGLAIGIGAAATQLYQLGAQWDDVADSITARTGMMGAELDGVMDQVSRVALDSSAPFAELGDIAGRVSASLGSTGDQLGEITAYIGDLNALTGEQTNIRQLAMMFRVFNVEAEDQVDVLNDLYGAFTNTQIPVNDLIGMMVSAGPKVKQFGMDINETAGLLGAFAEAGVNPQAAVDGLNKALRTFADNGVDAETGLANVVAKIKELTDAGRELEAQTLAADTFGRNFTPFLEAIQSGKVSVDSLNAGLKQTDLDIREVRASTDDFSQQWQRFKNFLSVELQPVATGVFSAINAQLEWFAGSMRGTIDGLKTAWNALRDVFSAPIQMGNIATGPAMAPAAPRDVIAVPGGAPASAPPVLGPRNPLDILVPGVPGRARGGIAGRTGSGRLFGPGTGTSDSILGVDPMTGIPTAWVSAGEGVVTASAMSRPGVAGLVGALNGYNVGFPTGIDAALLANVPAGRYSQTGSADLTQGLADCTSAIEDLVNLMDGMPTGGRSMSTANAHEWLLSRGFLPGSMPGAFNVGFNSGHMQATLPDGTPFNWGSDSAAANRGIGGTGAFDPSFTANYYRPVSGGMPVYIVGAAGATTGASPGVTSTVSPAGGMASTMGGQIGAPIAQDFGISGGLPGVASNLTTLLANLGFAPMIGALTGVKAGMDPTGSAGSGLFGIMGALGGFGGGGQQFGVPAPSNPIAAGANMFGGALGALPGPADPASTVGGITPAGGRGEGGLGIAGGLAGMAMSALQTAAGAGGMGANMMAPGAGAAISAAADIGIKLANRGAQFAGQAAGIGVGGLMEALLPVDSALADPMNSWFGRIVGGMMGAAPNLPNMAGQAASAPQNGQGGAQQPGADGRPPITVNYTNQQATEDRAGADLTNHLMAMNMGPGMQ